MKKEDILSLFVYLVMIAIAVLVGIFAINNIFLTYDGCVPGPNNARMGFAFLFVIVAIIFNVFYLEFAHIVGAKIGGYNILSFNVLGLCWYRANNKWKFRIKNFDGLTGETKIAPKRDKTSPKSFALAPLFALVLEVVIFMVLHYVLDYLYVSSDKQFLNGRLWWLSILSVFIVVIGGMLELYNIFPAKLDSMTDGYRLVILSKKENFAAYNEMMRIEYAYANQQELTDMKVFDSVTDFTCQVNLYSVYKYFKEKNFTEAEKILDHMIENKKNLNKGNYCSVIAQKMYLVLLNKPYDEAKKYYEEHINQEERRYIANDLTMESIRAYLLISSILDISEHEARYAIGRVNRALKRAIPGRAEIEKELLEVALNKVDEVRPEWHIKEKEVK